MTSTALTSLIERVEKLDGPDRETDARIWCYFAGVKYTGHHMAYAPYGGHNPQTLVEFVRPPKRTREVSGNIVHPHAEPVTSSIDAAVVLVERVLPAANCYGVEKDPKGIVAYVSRNNVKSGHWLYEGYHSQPAIALVLALLRALEAGRAP